MNDPIQHQITANPRPILNVLEASELLGVSKSFLDKMRVRGDGPPFHKVRRRVFYRRQEIDRWLDSYKRLSTSEARAA